jgi:pyruvate carboxylase
MRVVFNENELEARLDEAQGEARSAFGDASVFLEKYLPRARHLQVQVLADHYGNLTPSLRERLFGPAATSEGCRSRAGGQSRSHDPCRAMRRRRPIGPQGALSECRHVRVSLRCRLPEVVLHRSQSANSGRAHRHGDGHRHRYRSRADFDRPGSPAPRASHSAPETGERPALRSRVTTEDPGNNFAPDYGRISTYRSPAGFGIRLDGGTAYAGASIAPCYDSLLVKVTAWGAHLPEACQRMDRALREFRIRGVKTNMPFVENVAKHPQFRTGEITTSFLDEHPELFHFPRVATARPSCSATLAT